MQLSGLHTVWKEGKKMNNNLIICIGRQYGSGGREIGELLAKKLGIVCYDKLLLRQAAENSKISVSAMERNDEKPITADLTVSGNVFADLAVLAGEFYAESEKVFEAQRAAMLQIAEKGPCVIIGRCGSSVLRAVGANVLSVFIYADEKDRIRRIAERNRTDARTAEHSLHKTDRMRKKYFDFHSDTPWGEPESYDLLLSGSKFGVYGTVDILQNAVIAEMKRRCACYE